MATENEQCLAKQIRQIIAPPVKLRGIDHQGITRPSEGQSRKPPEYQALQGKNTTPGYYNEGFNRGNKAQVEEAYENIEMSRPEIGPSDKSHSLQGKYTTYRYYSVI